MTFKIFKNFHCIPLAILLMLSNLVFAASDDDSVRIGIMLFDGVLTSDVVAPMEVFGSAISSGAVKNYEVVTIAKEAGTITTQEGLTLTADYSIQNAPSLDVIIVGSRYGMDTILEDEPFMEFIRTRGAEADWLASNCSGAYILAEAGFLDGIKVTTYPGGEIWLKLNHPAIDIEIDETVVVDGNIVTSNGSLVSYEAAFELLSQLAGDAASQEVANLIYFNLLLERGSTR